MWGRRRSGRMNEQAGCAEPTSSPSVVKREQRRHKKTYDRPQSQKAGVAGRLGAGSLGRNRSVHDLWHGIGWQRRRLAHSRASSPAPRSCDVTAAEHSTGRLKAVQPLRAAPTRAPHAASGQPHRPPPVPAQGVHGGESPARAVVRHSTATLKIANRSACPPTDPPPPPSRASSAVLYASRSSRHVKGLPNPDPTSSVAGHQNFHSPSTCFPASLHRLQARRPAYISQPQRRRRWLAGKPASAQR